MKILRITVLLMHSVGFYAQSDLVFDHPMLATNCLIMGQSTHAVMMSDCKQLALGWTSTNYYTQTDCNGLQAVVLLPRKSAVWRVEGGFLTNSVLRRYLSGISWSQRISKAFYLGASMQLRRSRFPDLISYQSYWEVCSRFHWDRHQLIGWIRAFGPETYSRQMAEGGFFWRYRLGGALTIQAGLCMKSDLTNRGFAGLVQETPKEGQWCLWFEPRPIAVGVGWARQWGHWNWGLSVIWSEMPLPSFQQSMMYEKR